MPAQSLVVADQARLTSGTTTVSTPKLAKDFARGGDGSERLAAGRPCFLRVRRDRDGTSGALDGTLVINGANLPHPEAGNAAHQRFLGSDGATGRTVFTTRLAYAALAANNFVVLLNGTVKIPTTDFTVSDSGGFAVITLAVAAAVNDKLDVHKPTWSELLASGAHPFSDTQITGKDLYAFTGTHATNNLSRTRVVVEANAGA